MTFMTTYVYGIYVYVFTKWNAIPDMADSMDTAKLITPSQIWRRWFFISENFLGECDIMIPEIFVL